MGTKKIEEALKRLYRTDEERELRNEALGELSKLRSIVRALSRNLEEKAQILRDAVAEES